MIAEDDGDDEDEEDVEESQDFERDPKANMKKATGDEKKIPSDKTKLESSMPKTKNGMLKSVYEIANGLKKDQLSAKYEQIMKALSIVEQEEGEEDEEEASESRTKAASVKAEDLQIDVKDDISAFVEGEDALTDEF